MKDSHSSARPMSVSKDGDQVLMHLNEQTAAMWDISPRSIVPLRIALATAASPYQSTYISPGRVALSSDGRRLVTVGQEGRAVIWDAQTGQALLDPLAEPGNVARVRLNPDGQTAVVIQTNGWMRVWSVSDGKAVTPAFRDAPSAERSRAEDFQNDLSFSRDGHRLAVAWASGLAQVWDARGGKLLAAIPSQRAESTPQSESQRPPPFLAVLSPDGQHLATAGNDATARIWDAASGAALTEPLKHEDFVTSCQFSPDGAMLATASRDKTVRLWDARTGHEVFSPLKHGAAIASVHFSPDGGWLVTVSDDNLVQVWDTRRGIAVRTFKAEDAAPEGDLIRDGKLLLTISSEGGLRLWDVTTGTPLSETMNLPFTLHSGRMRPALSADGFHLALMEAGLVWLWELPRVSGPVPDWLPRLAEALAAKRITEPGLTERVEPGELLRIRQEVLGGSSDDVYGRWARWFFADRAASTLSPSSRVTLERHVQRCIEENSEASLQEALELEPGNVRALTIYLALTTSGDRGSAVYPGWSEQERKQQLRRSAAEAALLADNLLEAVPDSSIAWHARALALHRVDQNEDALAALGRANPAELGARYWNTKGLVLEQLSRNDEAYQAFSRAIELARATPSGRPSLHLLQRAEFLKRQNRLAEAGRDFCVARGIPPRDPATKPNLIDLSSCYTTMLTNIGALGAGNGALRELPVGVHTFGGTDFDIRGIIFGRSYYSGPRASVVSIPVKLRCRALHFLQSASAAIQAKDGMRVGKYTVHYAGGQTQEIPVLIGRHLWDWFYYEYQSVEASEAPVVWVGLNDYTETGHTFVRLHRMSWINPSPDVEIQSIDVDFGSSPVMPFLVALTAETDGAGATATAAPARLQRETVIRQTLEALDEAIARRPEHLAAVRAKAALLVSMGQTNEALALFSKIVADAQAKDPPATNLLTAALSDRSAMLRRMNRTAEAQADWLRAIGVPARSLQAGTNLIDLTDYYNGSLTRGWIPSSQFGTTAERNLGELPQGVQKLGGVSFDVRGVIQLAGHSLIVVLRGSFPVQVKGVRIGQPCHRLHFLQGTGWRAPEGTAIGRYVIHYADGRQQAVPLIYGENVRDWWFNPKLEETTKNAVVAWTGSNPAVRDRGQALRLYKFTWENPWPDTAIESLDLVSENSNSSPFLIALTVE